MTVSLDTLQSALGYVFKDHALLRRALTHTSRAQTKGDGASYERLEFLGDRVLNLMTAELLWRRFPDAPEGELARRLNALVRKESCAEAARHFNLPEHLELSAAEVDGGGRDNPSIQGDACEAVIGAAFVDGGLDAARVIYDKFWPDNMARLMLLRRDSKSELQEWTQSKGKGLPDYDVADRSGPDHAPTFVVDVKVDGAAAARGEGASKRAAEQAAASAFLVREGVWSAADGDV